MEPIFSIGLADGETIIERKLKGQTLRKMQTKDAQKPASQT